MKRLLYLLVLLLFFAPLLASCNLDGHSLHLEEGEEQQELEPGDSDDEEEEEDLWQAAKNGNLARVQYLLDHGADPNLQEEDGWTALMAAADKGHTGVVQALLAGGADPNLQVSEVIFKGWTALMAAAQGGHTGIVKLLLKRGARPNLQNKDGWTALMQAALRGHREVVQLLLKRGAYPNLQNRWGYTALMLAVQRVSAVGNIPLFKLLIDTPQDLSLTNDQGQTALDIAEMEFETATGVNRQFYSFAIAQLKKKM